MKEDPNKFDPQLHLFITKMMYEEHEHRNDATSEMNAYYDDKENLRSKISCMFDKQQQIGING